VINLLRFTRVNRLLVSCYQPKPNFIVIKIPGENRIFCDVGADGGPHQWRRTSFIAQQSLTTCDITTLNIH